MMRKESLFSGLKFSCRIISYSISILIFFQLQGCKKYLEKKSDNSITSIERIEDLQALLDNNTQINFQTVPLYSEASSDNYFLTEYNYFYNNGSGEKGQAAYTWKYFVNLYENDNDWAKGYVPINMANICLEWIDRFPKTPANILSWNNVKGSALFIRSFNMMNLSFVYSKAYDKVESNNDLGIALRLTTDYNEPTIRSTVTQSYRQIISDAKESLLYLPYTSLHPLRPSKAAAYGLLARIYLSMRMYDSSGIYADSSLQFQNDLIDYNGDADIVNAINSTSSPFKQYNKETIFYADMSTGLLNYLVNSGNVDSSLYSDYDNNDLRKVAFFTIGSNGYQKFKGNYTQTSYQLFGGITTAEMILTRAECYVRGGKIPEAMVDVNSLLRKRWNKNVLYPVMTAIDKDDGLNKILSERRKELLFRGLRWMDIKRLNKESPSIIPKRIISTQIITLEPNSDRYALPLPQDIIDFTGIQQNPGWGM